MPVNFPAMSWLVAVSFPVLLMLFTVGLQRIETVLHGDRLPVAEFVARVESAARTAGQKAAERTLGELSAITPVNRLDSNTTSSAVTSLVRWFVTSSKRSL